MNTFKGFCQGHQVYIFNADILCENCGRAQQERLQPDEDSNYYPAGPFSDGGGEADTPRHCGDCGLFLENPLTIDGEKYVVDAVASGDGDKTVLALWRERYDYLFGNGDTP